MLTNHLVDAYDIYFHPDVILVQRYFKYIP